MAMLAKSDCATGIARRWFWITLVITGSLVIAEIALAFLLSNAIIRPIRELTEATASIAGGNFERRSHTIRGSRSPCPKS